MPQNGARLLALQVVLCYAASRTFAVTGVALDASEVDSDSDATDNEGAFSLAEKPSSYPHPIPVSRRPPSRDLSHTTLTFYHPVSCTGERGEGWGVVISAGRYCPSGARLYIRARTPADKRKAKLWRTIVYGFVQ